MINEVSYNDILDIRHKVMYPDKDRSFVILPEDEKGLHIGYHIDDKPVSIFSVFLDIEKRELQFRKFATLPEHQGKGYGSKLMQWIVDYAKDMQFEKTWCNSRIDKTDFYKKFGFVETDQTFEKDGYKYVIVERKTIPSDK